MRNSMKTVLGAAIAGAFTLSAGAAMADGDAVAGKKVFNKCKTCHTPVEGARKMGPHLGCIIGRKAASVEGYKYSKAMAASGLTWDEATLSAYLANPKGLVKGTKMSFAGIKKEDQMANLLEYLEHETGGDACE